MRAFYQLSVALVCLACSKTPAKRNGVPAVPHSAPFSTCLPMPCEQAEKTASGLVMKVLRAGTGSEHATDSDRVRVHYTGWNTDGAVFDSSLPRGEPGLFSVAQVIPGWAEALKRMLVGEQRRVWISARLAYGESPLPGAPAGDLMYDLELVEIIRVPKPPEDVAAPPPSATRTRSGLAYRVLGAGTGKVHPKETDTVVVQYSGWTTDSLLFDSSLLRGGPLSFALAAVIRGFSEGVQRMVVGDKMRFWMPSNLAYGDSPTEPDTPSGMLVYDIELLEIR
jgi:FKBP-type peptidyl-prolyl cis-trans isomerase